MLHNSTPFPNWLLDEAMPSLKDTEWRLLCVVVRQTLGWSDGEGGRKGLDWITHSQLKHRTNRASAAVSQAVDALVNRRWIEVVGEEGRCLATPGERRHARGRLFYRLHPRLLADKTSGISESEFRKAKTTKENETKGSQDYLSFLESEKVRDVGTERSPFNSQAAGSKIDLDSTPIEALRFLEEYGHLYEERFGLPMPSVTKTDVSLLIQKIEMHGWEKLRSWIPRFFSSSFTYAERQRHSFASFLNSDVVLSMIRNASPVEPQ